MCTAQYESNGCLSFSHAEAGSTSINFTRINPMAVLLFYTRNRWSYILSRKDYAVNIMSSHITNFVGLPLRFFQGTNDHKHRDSNFTIEQWLHCAAGTKPWHTSIYGLCLQIRLWNLHPVNDCHTVCFRGVYSSTSICVCFDVNSHIISGNRLKVCLNRFSWKARTLSFKLISGKWCFKPYDSRLR